MRNPPDQTEPQYRPFAWPPVTTHSVPGRSRAPVCLPLSHVHRPARSRRAGPKPPARPPRSPAKADLRPVLEPGVTMKPNQESGLDPNTLLWLSCLGLYCFPSPPIRPDLRQFRFPVTLGKEEVPPELVIHPECSCSPEELRKPKCSVRRQVAAPVDQAVHALKGNADALSQLGLGHSQRFEELLSKHLAWVCRCAVRGNPDHG